MLRRALSFGRYLIVVPIIGVYLASIGLLFYEMTVVVVYMADAAMQGNVSPKVAKALAVGLIEALDVFLIAIVAYIMSLGLYKLFVDDTLPLPSWLRIRDMDDLKLQLVGVVIVVLGVLFMREAVAWDGQRDLLNFGAALALVMAALSGYLWLLKGRKN